MTLSYHHPTTNEVVFIEGDKVRITALDADFSYLNLEGYVMFTSDGYLFSRTPGYHEDPRDPDFIRHEVAEEIEEAFADGLICIEVLRDEQPDDMHHEIARWQSEGGS